MCVCVCVLRTFKIYSLSNFQVYITIWLIIVTVQYIRSPELIHLITGSLYPLTNVSPFPPNPQALAITSLLSLSVSLVFLDSTYRHTSFYCASLYCPLQILHFLRIEGLWQPCIKQSVPFFQKRLLSVSVSHIGNSRSISNFFIIIIFDMVICDQ